MNHVCGSQPQRERAQAQGEVPRESYAPCAANAADQSAPTNVRETCRPRRWGRPPAVWRPAGGQRPNPDPTILASGRRLRIDREPCCGCSYAWSLASTGRDESEHGGGQAISEDRWEPCRQPGPRVLRATGTLHARPPVETSASLWFGIRDRARRHRARSTRGPRGLGSLLL